MLQFDLQFYEELTVARVKTVKFISGAFFWSTGQLVILLLAFVRKFLYQILYISTILFFMNYFSYSFEGIYYISICTLFVYCINAQEIYKLVKSSH